MCFHSAVAVRVQFRSVTTCILSQEFIDVLFHLIQGPAFYIQVDSGQDRVISPKPVSPVLFRASRPYL